MVLRVALTFNDDRGLGSSEGLDRAAVEGVQLAAQAIATALAARGHEVHRVPVHGPPSALLEALARIRPELVFNQVESVNGDARLEAGVAHLYAWLGLRFTGSPPAALSLALDKGLSKAVLVAAGLPTPRGRTLQEAHDLGGLEPPWIIKPRALDASHGIDQDSVTSDPARALERARHLRATYDQPALVEEYVEGRELNVSLLERGGVIEALSPGEIDFSALPADRPRILTYAAKWEEASLEFGATPAVAARDVGEEVLGLAKAAFLALGLRGYGRVDLRLHPTRGPFVLEVNPNPDLSPGAGLALAAARSGIRYEELIERIALAALHPHAAGIAPG